MGLQYESKRVLITPEDKGRYRLVGYITDGSSVAEAVARCLEETGQIDDLLLEVSDFYDREVDYDLKTLTARIEPLLLVIVSGMVLILALGIFLPMWNMLDVVKGS